MNIPIELMLDILSRSSAKSIVKFRYTSKFWSLLLHGPYFTELFLTRSSSRPRILLAMERAGEWRVFSILQPQDSYKKPSLIVAADYHMKFPGQMCLKDMCGPVYGLIYFPNMRFLDKNNKSSLYVPVIFNPGTGQYLRLPIRNKRYSKSFLGFDPIHKQFKVLAVPYPSPDLYEHYIITLGTGNDSWRMIQCPFAHYPRGESEGICIDGVLYYLAYRGSGHHSLIVCFDVRLEKFKFIEEEYFCYNTKLVNFKGKLGGISSQYVYTDGIVLKLVLWVLEDAEKHIWSENVYTLRDYKFFDCVCDGVSILGVTAAGEIVMSMDYTRKRFYVMYFSPERYTLQSFCRVYAFSDYVEDFKFL